MPHNTSPTFFLIAGEASGDVLGAHLMRALKRKTEGRVRFAGIGGPHMQAEGIELLFPHTELMHFGVVEVLRHIPRLLKRINQTVQEIIRTKPDALITIDSPDFCFRVAKKVKRIQPLTPLIHYVAPTVWAWRPGRARKIARFLDHLMVVLPFEPPYFLREGLPCTFVGHPVVETEAAHGSNIVFRNTLGIAPDVPLLTVLPGSRVGEVTRLLPIFREAVEIIHSQHRTLQIVVPTVPWLLDRVMAEVSGWGMRVHVVVGDRDKYNGFAASRVALACSGTVALELALARLPSVIAYKINDLTAFIYRRFIRTPYVNLINIMHNKVVMPELLQENCTSEKLARAVDRLLRDPAARQEQIDCLATAGQWLGQGQFIPSDRAAETVLKAIEPQPPTPPAILQVLPALVTGGVERGTVETVAALVKNGFRAFVASSGGPMAREVEQAGGVHITLPLKSKNPWTIWRNIARLSTVIRKHKIDIVHARSRAPAWSACYAAARCHVPFVTTFHSAYGAKSKLKRWYNSAMARGQRVIAISGFVANYAAMTYDIDPDILRTIPRGVDIDFFAPEHITPQRMDALRGAWNLPQDAKVILMPARITRWKGQSVVVQALAQLDRQDYICVIVGGGIDSAYGRELAEDIKRASLHRHIALFDTCRDMPAAYALADLVLAPSTRPEGFGRVVIEAQAMGAPVIATDHGGARETVIEGETGWRVEPGNADELSLTIDKVLSLSPEQRQKMAAHSIAHIRAHFTTEAMTSETLAVYRELLQTK